MLFSKGAVVVVFPSVRQWSFFVLFLYFLHIVVLPLSFFRPHFMVNLVCQREYKSANKRRNTSRKNTDELLIFVVKRAWQTANWVRVFKTKADVK